MLWLFLSRRETEVRRVPAASYQRMYSVICWYVMPLYLTGSFSLMASAICLLSIGFLAFCRRRHFVPP